MASFFVRWKRRSWSVLKQEYKDGESVQTTVPKELYPELGINPAWTLEEVKARIKNLNGRGKIDRLKAVAAARRAEFDASVSSIFVDPVQADQFTERLLYSTFAKDDSKMIYRWTTVQRLVKELQLEPHEFGTQENKILHYMRDQRFSPDYVAKLIRILNLWGDFVCEAQDRRFKPIKVPRGHAMESIREAYLTKPKNRAGGAKPFTDELLKSKQSLFTVPGQFEWLLISLWFGLRPSEINKNFKVTVEPDGTEVLWIYQTKLTTLRKEDRWKLIPVLFEEQKRAISYFKLGSYKKPLLKKVKEVFGPRYGLYSGRKGFTDLMLSRGRSLENISAWLGHSSIDLTWKHYRNKKRVQY